MVRLKDIHRQRRIGEQHTFQFQYGSIKRQAGRMRQAISSTFQFQYGSIKSSLAALNAVLIPCFNSNMVRLKVLPRYLVKFTSFKFQFQYGSIKRSYKILHQSRF